jgi:chemotaxis receptor (MCP) glutamine deamidase CheD
MGGKNGVVGMLGCLMPQVASEGGKEEESKYAEVMVTVL